MELNLSSVVISNTTWRLYEVVRRAVCGPSDFLVADSSRSVFRRKVSFEVCFVAQRVRSVLSKCRDGVDSIGFAPRFKTDSDGCVEVS